MPIKACSYIIQRMEDKLKEYMSPEEYSEFSEELAKESFRIEIEGMDDSEFKDFTLEHFDKFTGTDDEFESFMKGVADGKDTSKLN